MVRKKKNLVNDTLNNLMLKIFGGVNYASKLAVETGKSIPVVFKQLDELVKNNILEKQRSGKRVEYTVNWKTISGILSGMVEKEVVSAKNISEKDAPEELILLIKEFSSKNMNTLKKTVENILQLVPIQESFSLLSQELEKAMKVSQKYSKLEFKDNLLYFLDSLGMLDEKQKKSFVSKFTDAEKKIVEEFLKLCRLHYLLGKANDPRKEFAKKLR